MSRVQDILSIWYIKAIFGFFLSLFAPIQTSVIITFIMILLDTITGIATAIKRKRFNSKHLKKGFKKVVIYSACLLTIRLVEVGVLGNMASKVISQIMAGFLIVTEATSILENLKVLGLPLPITFLNLLFKQPLEEIVLRNQKERRELGDIEDILYFLVPTIKADNMRKLMQIKVESSLGIAKDIIAYLDGLEKSDNELIYYKVSSIIEKGFKEMHENWVEEGIPQECIKNFSKWRDSRIQNWMKDVKEICYRIIPADKKKDELLKKLTILLYNTISDVQKGESEIACKGCENK